MTMANLTTTGHRMADPAVRLRAGVMATLLITLTWIVVTVLGRPAGPFTQDELPELAGLPIRVPQIERLFRPHVGEQPIPQLPNSVAPSQAPSQGSASP